MNNKIKGDLATKYNARPNNGLLKKILDFFDVEAHKNISWTVQESKTILRWAMESMKRSISLPPRKRSASPRVLTMILQHPKTRRSAVYQREFE